MNSSQNQVPTRVLSSTCQYKKQGLKHFCDSEVTHSFVPEHLISIGEGNGHNSRLFKGNTMNGFKTHKKPLLLTFFFKKLFKVQSDRYSWDHWWQLATDLFNWFSFHVTHLNLTKSSQVNWQKSSENIPAPILKGT